MYVRVAEITRCTPSISAFKLVPEGGEVLPNFTSGSHIDVHLPGGFMRQYSLYRLPSDEQSSGGNSADNSATRGDRKEASNGEDGPSCYRIAVKREPDSRGGSIAAHELEEGARLEISEPRNNFPIIRGAQRQVLLAAGVGITPIFEHARRLQDKGADFQVLYVARSAEEAALSEELEQMCPGKVECVFGENRRADHAAMVREVIEGPEPEQRSGGFLKRATRKVLGKDDPARFHGVHVYMCGPAGFMDSARAVAREFLPDTRIHNENFHPRTSAHQEGDEPFVVEVDGEEFTIGARETIAEVLDRHDVPVYTSCEEGTCGTCQMMVVEGAADHRDSVFSAEQHQAGRIATCVSRAAGEKLILRRCNQDD